MYGVRLIHIKKQVGEKRSTVATHRNADCLLKNTSTKHSKYVVNQNLENVNISFRNYLAESVFYCFIFTK
jgi:hypothetical protein